MALITDSLLFGEPTRPGLSPARGRLEPWLVTGPCGPLPWKIPFVRKTAGTRRTPCRHRSQSLVLESMEVRMAVARQFPLTTNSISRILFVDYNRYFNSRLVPTVAE
jgi:hypothetical protein